MGWLLRKQRQIVQCPLAAAVATFEMMAGVGIARSQPGSNELPANCSRIALFFTASASSASSARSRFPHVNICVGFSGERPAAPTHCAAADACLPPLCKKND